MENLSFIDVFTLTTCVLITVIVFFWWVKYGRNKVNGVTVEFYPPKGFEFWEIEYLYKGYCRKASFFTLLYILEAKGYVEEKRYNIICKVKDYDGDSKLERCFMEELSKLSGNTLHRADSGRFMRKVWGKYESLFFNKTLKRISVFLFISMFVIAVNYIMPGGAYVLGNLFSLFFIFIGVMYGCILALLVLVFIGMKKLYRSRHFNSIFGWIFALVYLVLGGMVCYGGINYMMPSESNSFLGLIISILLILVLTLICDMERRTEYGNMVYCRILGFKEFLRTVHKEQLEEMVKKDPNYINEVTPYFKLFEISDWVL